MIPEDELRLQLLWRERWSAAGWEPFVLTEWQARQNPYFAEFDQAISKFPSANPATYERACFLRWLALEVAGGGFMSDFDVIIYDDVRLEDPANHYWFELTGQERNKLQYFQRVCPSLVYASEQICRQLTKLFATGEFGRRNIDVKDDQGQKVTKPHFSDQYAIEDIGNKMPELIQRHDLVKGYCDDHWETAPFVHYSNSSTMPRGKTPRWKHIPDLRK